MIKAVRVDSPVRGAYRGQADGQPVDAGHHALAAIHLQQHASAMHRQGVGHIGLESVAGGPVQGRQCAGRSWSFSVAC